MNNSPRTGRDDWLPAARLAGIPIVASARGDAAPLPGTGLRVAVHRALMRRFDRVISVSEYIAAAMRAQGIPSDRVLVVHDGVDRTKLERLGARTSEEIRRDLGVPGGKVFVAMVGNVREWKGQHVVIEALGTLGPEVRERMIVVFVGAVRDEDKAYLAGLQRRAGELGVEEIVRFSGSRSDVPEIMSVADVMVHASVLPEPGGTVVIESMTFGAPVVVASKGGHLDYLLEGMGLIHDVEHPEELGAHLRTLVLDPALRSKMALEAKQRAAEFSIEATAEKLHRVYDAVLRARSR
jgi:glycosyltransferase involved in cell wall biosynthesis